MKQSLRRGEGWLLELASWVQAEVDVGMIGRIERSVNKRARKAASEPGVRLSWESILAMHVSFVIVVTRLESIQVCPNGRLLVDYKC